MYCFQFISLLFPGGSSNLGLKKSFSKTIDLRQITTITLYNFRFFLCFVELVLFFWPSYTWLEKKSHFGAKQGGLIKNGLPSSFHVFSVFYVLFIDTSSVTTFYFIPSFNAFSFLFCVKSKNESKTSRPNTLLLKFVYPMFANCVHPNIGIFVHVWTWKYFFTKMYQVLP